MPKLGEAFVVIRAALGPLRTGLATARNIVGSAMRAISGVVTKAVTAITNAIRSIMAAMYKWTKRAMLGVVAAVTLATRSAAKFQEQMAFVATMVTRDVRPTMERFRKEILRMSMEFGEGTDKLAGGLYDILSASIPAGKAIDVLTVAVKAAQGGMTDTKTAADAITTVLNAYGYEAERASEVSDKLFATVLRGKTTFGELAGSLGKAAATSAIVGLSLEELLATIATATRAGIRIDEAMTSVVGVLAAFLKPSSEAQEAVAGLDMELSSAWLQANGLRKAILELNDASAEQLMTIVPNRRAFKGLAAAMKDVEGFSYDVNLITEKYADQAEEARKKTETFGRELKRLWATVRTIAVEFATPLLAPFTKGIEGVRGELVKLLQIVRRNQARISEYGYRAVGALTGVYRFLREKIPQAWDYMAGLIDANRQRFKSWADFVAQETKRAIGYLRQLWDIREVEGFGAAIRKVFADVAAALRAAFDYIKETQVPRIEKALTRTFNAMRPVMLDLGKTIAAGFWTAIKTIPWIFKGWVTEFALEAGRLVKTAVGIRGAMGEQLRLTEIARQRGAGYDPSKAIINRQSINRLMPRWGMLPPEMAGAGFYPTTESQAVRPIRPTGLMKSLRGLGRSFSGTFSGIGHMGEYAPSLAEVVRHRGGRPLEYPQMPATRAVGHYNLDEVVQELRKVNDKLTSIDASNKEVVR